MNSHRRRKITCSNKRNAWLVYSIDSGFISLLLPCRRISFLFSLLITCWRSKKILSKDNLLQQQLSIHHNQSTLRRYHHLSPPNSLILIKTKFRKVLLAPRRAEWLCEVIRNGQSAHRKRSGSVPCQLDGTKNWTAVQLATGSSVLTRRQSQIYFMKIQSTNFNTYLQYLA